MQKKCLGNHFGSSHQPCKYFMIKFCFLIPRYSCAIMHLKLDVIDLDYFIIHLRLCLFGAGKTLYLIQARLSNIRLKTFLLVNQWIEWRAVIFEPLALYFWINVVYRRSIFVKNEFIVSLLEKLRWLFCCFRTLRILLKLLKLIYRRDIIDFL